ncbi:MAG: DUF3800 domain-containing protein [Candidatus Eisenbacteria bacterium]|nr:DUF3800 domain-containing protein [Candidatus Eisenbacteria bacterium]
MYLCYLDESGTPEPGGTSHFVLLGMALPATSWKRRDAEVSALKTKHRLSREEVHTAWMLRRYPEQERIADFTALDDAARRAAVRTERKADLAKASLRGPSAVKNRLRDYKKTEAYVHLTFGERLALVRDLADAIGTWNDVVIFADSGMKSAHHGAPKRLFSFAFEQVVTRFHHYLTAVGGGVVGLMVQDNNPTAADHLTTLMRDFHDSGTKWASIDRIVETPLFVDSRLTAMVQLADLCSFAVRRFFENGETDLFDRIYGRFDRTGSKLVGLRHYTGKTPCQCKVCVDHGR